MADSVGRGVGVGEEGGSACAVSQEAGTLENLESLSVQAAQLLLLLSSHQLFPSEKGGPASLKDPDFQVNSHMSLHDCAIQRCISEAQERKSVAGLEEARCYGVNCLRRGPCGRDCTYLWEPSVL